MACSCVAGGATATAGYGEVYLYLIFGAVLLYEYIHICVCINVSWNRLLKMHLLQLKYLSKYLLK